MKKHYLVYGAAALLLTACSTAPRSQSDRDVLIKEADATVEIFKTADPDLKRFFDQSSAGYAVFPSIAKGGWIFGGAYGRGVLYEKTPAGTSATGYVDTTHASVGLQWGGQSFSEIVFLETPDAVGRFKYGKLKLSGSLSAVAVRSGASKAVNYSDSVAIFTLGEAGLMLEGAVGAQKFGFKAK